MRRGSVYPLTYRLWDRPIKNLRLVIPYECVHIRVPEKVFNHYLAYTGQSKVEWVMNGSLLFYTFNAQAYRLTLGSDDQIDVLDVNGANGILKYDRSRASDQNDVGFIMDIWKDRRAIFSKAKRVLTVLIITKICTRKAFPLPCSVLDPIGLITYMNHLLKLL